MMSKPVFTTTDKTPDPDGSRSRKLLPEGLKLLFLTIGMMTLMLTEKSPAAVAEDLRIIICPLVEEGPVIDGRLDDEVWQRAPLQTRMSSRDGRTAADPHTQFRMLTDGDWLYFGIELFHPEDMSRYDLENRGPNQVDFRHETVEVFIAPDYDDEQYFQFALEPGGSDYDNVPGSEPIDFTSGWRHATGMHDDHWVAEIAVPLAGIGFESGLPAGARIAFNVCRTTSGPVNLQAWSPPGFHSRSSFGEAVIGSFQEAVAKRLGELQEQSANLELTAATEAALKELGDFGAEVEDGAGWRTFLSQAYQLRRQLLQQSLGGRNMVVWEADPWALPPSDTMPPLGFEAVESIRVQAFQGEHLVHAVGIANTGGRLLQVRALPKLEITSIDGTASVPFHRHVEIRQALEVAMSGSPSRDVLPRLQYHDTMAVPAGGNGILWLNINTHGLEPGLWNTEIELLPMVQQQFKQRIPVVIEVLPARLPQGPRPYALAYCANPYNGGFMNSEAAGPYDRETAVQDLKDYLVNAFFIPAGETGFQTMEYDEAGRIIGPPDMSAMEKWIEDFGSDGMFYVLSLWYDYLPRELGGGGEWGEIEEENFGRFVGYVREFFAERGVGVEDFAWYAHDEPGVEAAHSVANFGRLLQATDPAQQIYVTVYGSTPWEALEIMAPYVNLWVPSLGMNQQQRDFLNQQDARFFSYLVWGRGAHPYRHIRAIGTRAFELGYESVGIWAYGAWDTMSGQSLWHDEPHINKYSLNYEGEGEMVPSVRKEGWRMAIQDYRYCEWLTELADQTPDPELAEKAGRLLAGMMREKGTSTRAIDNAIKEMRPLLMDMLVSLDTVDADEWRQHQELEIPALLTYNGESFALRRIDTGGYYYYDYDRTASQYGENSKVADGNPIYFRGRDAVDGPQAENREDGNLTDGLFHRPGSFLLFWAPETLSVTFDFKDAYRLDQALFYGSECQFTALVSGSGEDDDWVEVDALPREWPEAKINHEGAAMVDLQGREARYLRLRFRPEPERPDAPGRRRIQLIEVKVFGQPLP